MEESLLLLGFKEENEDTNSSTSLRLVPWLNWNEWIFVKHALFSNSTSSISSALNRISAWRSRGSLPITIEITASIIEIRLKDPYFQMVDHASDSDEILSMLYCMAITRLVNGVIEKTRVKELVSIAVAAEAIGIPRTLIDIRHEASHRELPSLKVVRTASIKALDWLKSYYWEPQSKAIPFQGERNDKVKKEIKSKIRELAICVKVKGNPQPSTSLLKGKRVKHGELLLGRNKLLSLTLGKSQSSQSGGSKKQIAKILKSVLRLYSSFSSEIVSVLLEYLLKAMSSAEFKENADAASVGLTIQSVLADWKPVILKFWDKEPELLINLLKEVLDMIETREDMKCDGDNPCTGISHASAEFCRSDYLSSLFAWLVAILSKVPSSTANVPKKVLLELLHKCLIISQLCNKQLMDSALYLAELVGDRSLLERAKRLYLIGLSNLDYADDKASSVLTTKNIFQCEESIHEAAKKLELVKQQVLKNKAPRAVDCENKKAQTWSLAKSWNPCPIGMLPRAVGSSGCLPVLDHIDNQKQTQVSERKEDWKLIQHGTKRDATEDLQLLDNSTVKKMRDTKESGELNGLFPTDGVKGCLMVAGVWKRVGEEELQAIQSSLRILV
ncbi:hypothetical protein TanjilG_29582 [Lupinus angustifolius]|uniref:Ribosomal biogenesis protein LAS1L n=1 Tax=Lupinus angustifolius TaxID=3871 RepID=A0A4P1R623_LUPAN|nr:PREDICTED: uncharacterized protein LOC109360161 isoform X1 [Lupinus angustifolius]OIW02806.1 hypothetical protein TanjilG_29582 [Lupinus angustifolius]